MERQWCKVGFGNLQDELLLQIFHKLALKSVVRCKLVCNRWRSLITDPFFTSNYNPSSLPNHPTSFIMIPRCSPYSGTLVTFMYELHMGSTKYHQRSLAHQRVWTAFSEKGGPCRVEVLGSWNGLVALHNSRGEFRLVNPWTREEKRVRVDVFAFGFGFDLFRLCHDPTRGEYKAVLSRCGSTYFYVVSFKDGKWKSKTQPSLLKDLNRHGFGLEVWGLKGEDSWTKLFSVVSFSPSTTISLSLWVANDKVLINGHYETKLTVCNFRDQGLQELAWLNSMQWGEVKDRESFSPGEEPHRIVTFGPSLVSPNHCGRFCA